MQISSIVTSPLTVRKACSFLPFFFGGGGGGLFFPFSVFLVFFLVFGVWGVGGVLLTSLPLDESLLS